MLKAGANVRKRVLEPEEYLVLKKNLDKHQKVLCKLALCSRMPLGEVIPIKKSNKEEGTRGLIWDRVDFKNRMILFEADDTKTGEARQIPITDEIKEVFNSISRDISCNYVFTYPGVPLSNIRGGVNRACSDAQMAFGMKAKGRFVFWDLSTTTDTLMARGGVQEVYRRALLAHNKRMDRHYVHPDFEKDLRAVMEKYTCWLGVELEAAKQSVDQTVDQEGNWWSW